MQFADQPAGVTGVSQALADQRREGGKCRIPVAIDVNRAGIHAGEKAGAAWRTDWRLAEGAFEGDAIVDQLVEVGRGQMGKSQRGYGVVALLVGANPENVWFAIIKAHFIPLAYFNVSVMLRF